MVRLALVRLAGVALVRLALRALIPDERFEGRLEELTPELPDLADGIGHGPQRYNSRPRRCVDYGHRLGIRHALGMDPDHAKVDATLLNHKSADSGIALEPPGRGDLEPHRRDHVAADEAGDRHPLAADVRLDVSLWTDHQVAVTLDLPTEIAQDLSTAFDLEPSREDVVPGT